MCTALVASMAAAGCVKPVPVPDGNGPKIVSVAINSGDQINIPGEISFTVVVSDATVNLSTLDISAALEDGTLLVSATERTVGKESTVTSSIQVPFGPGMRDGENIILTFTAVNIDGATSQEVRRIRIVRPVLPQSLYLTIDGEVYPMYRSTDSPLVYVTDSERGFGSIVSAVIATSEDMAEAEFIWGRSSEDNRAEICQFSNATGISVSFPSVLVDNYAFDTESFVISAIGSVLDVVVNGRALAPQAGILYASVDFTRDTEFTITGLDNLEEAYNRDFFAPSTGNRFTFVRESGTYDVYYSPKYNYIWVARMNAVAPECLWVMGHGFTCAPVWHNSLAKAGWSDSEITELGYAVKVAEDKYQCSMYLNNNHDWASFEFEVYSDRQWDKGRGFGGQSLSGFTKGVALSGARDGKPGLTSDTGFQPGYYVITFDNARGDIHLERITPWEDTGSSGIFINGTELEIAPDGYCYADIHFEQGEELVYIGMEASELNRDFFSQSGGTYTFAAASGRYKFQYFPEFGYSWLSNDFQSFPDCIYILGSGKWSAPDYDDENTPLWADVAYERRAPYFVVAPRIADGTYKATMSMSTSNYDRRVLLEFYSDLQWGQDGTVPTVLTGPDASNFFIDGTYLRGVDGPENPFTKGNYEFIISVLPGGLSINITKL